MNRAIGQRGFNAENPESALELIEKPIPSAAPGYVVVHIKLRPINPTDLVTIRTGRIARYVEGTPTPGSEGYGIVHAVGEGVTKVNLGQRVVPFMWEGLRVGEGSWQEYVSVREDMLTAVPNSIPDEVAAQFVINPWTAYGMLIELGIPKGEYLLQTAAGSVIGRQIIQLAKHWGIRTINVIRRAEQTEELKELGADEVICSQTEDVISRVKAITSGRLAHGALDCVGGELTKSVTGSVRRGGLVLIYGVLSGPDAKVRINDLFRQVHVKGWILSTSWEDKEKRKLYIEETWKLLEAKVIQPFSGENFDLADFKHAIEKSEEIGRGGKVFLSSAFA
ncbi:hypothetical protein O6H91_11G057500 [Diphasiastrum complanatum]|uniref:Uncharacterized protein n=1 Tax=Diphasiastrum complanatum TaxID=34168 RepID=A0ACC2C9B1_DIPCM|nr:hypothetical protein O6H91_11G057500 [Diphasiastrum complanatum]